MNGLIIGAGQIGKALFEIFSEHYPTWIRDVEDKPVPPGIEVLHIAFPYSTDFVKHVKAYIAEYKPKLTIIHSTVKVGTTDECGPHVVHSPERGRFPNLAREMLCYKKFIGGFDVEDLSLATIYFEEIGWPVQTVSDARTTEMLKLVSNAHMGLEIAWRQQLERWGIDGDAYKLWEDSYFHGYMYLGQSQLVRSRMRPDPIGGHCILQSIDILASGIKNPFERLILDYIDHSNERTKREEKASETSDARATEVPAVR